MVRVIELVKISNIDDVEIMGGIHVIDRYVYLGWYHDRNYGSDEYGCTVTPNIFHNWIMKIDDLRQGKLEHINIFGDECTKYVLWRNVGLWLSSFYPGYERRNLLVLGGYDYGDYRSRLFIIDVTDPENPSLVKIITGTTAVRNDGAFLTCSKRNDTCIIGCLGVEPTSAKADVYKITLRDLAEIDSMDGLELITNDVADIQLINHRYAIGNGLEGTDKAGKHYLIDTYDWSISEISASDAPKFIIGRFGISIENGNIVHGFIVKDETFEHIGSVSLSETLTPEITCQIICDGRALISDRNGKAYIVHVTENDINIEKSLLLEQTIARCDITIDGTLICGKPGMTVQSILEVVPDHKYILSSNGKVKVVDENNNPVENLELSVFEMNIFRTVSRSHTKAIACNIGSYLGSVYTDADGTADLSQFGKGNMIVLSRW